MKRHLLLLALVFLCSAGIATAIQQQFMFGAWSGGEPSQAVLPQFTQMLSNTLHFNTWLGYCYAPEHLQAYTAAGLKVISSNDWNWNDTVTYWPRVYTESAYSVFESEGTDIGQCHLVYRGGVQVEFGDTKCRHFAAVGHRVDSLIQTGPGVQDQCSYGQAGWYYPQHLPKRADNRYHYTAQLRFKLGTRPPEAQNDTIAVFYIYRGGYPDEGIPGQDDPMIVQYPVYILNSAFGDAATDFDTVSLSYHYNNPMGGREERFVWNINYQVRWYGTRDIYLDQVKVSDVFGRQLWEPSDTVVGFPNLRDQAAAYYGNSPTILGWYLVDDQSMMEDRDNVLSARRVDSLLGAWYPGKKGFVVPGAHVDYLSLAGYSNISFQTYPIRKCIDMASDPSNPFSLQTAWDNDHIPHLASMKELALSKGLPCYATIQSFEGYESFGPMGAWRRPTAEEHLCMVNLALAYGVKGILYWKYSGCGFPTLDSCSDGLVYDSDVFADTTTTWSEIKNVVGPYIEKMGPIFASLKWKDAWKWGDWPPSEAIIWDIQCDQYGQPGQDPLYLQVAEFAPINPVDCGRYFFLVNRRCLSDESISGHLTFLDFNCDKTTVRSYYITDMLTDSVTVTGSVPPVPLFNFSVPAGAGRLYRVTPYPPCHHGDANGSGSINISDAVFLIAYIFAGGPARIHRLPVMPTAAKRSTSLMRYI